MKNRFKKIIKYFTIIDLIIVFLLATSIVDNISIIRNFNYMRENNSVFSLSDIKDCIFNPQKIKDMWLDEDIKKTRAEILSIVGDFNFFSSQDFKMQKEEYEKINELKRSHTEYNNEAYISYSKKVDLLKDNFYEYASNNYYRHSGFVFINKNTGEIITNETYAENSVGTIRDVDRIKEIILRGFKDYTIKVYENEDIKEEGHNKGANEYIEIYIRSEDSYERIIENVNYTVKRIVLACLLLLALIVKLLFNIRRRKLGEIKQINKWIFKHIYRLTGIEKVMLYLSAIKVCIKGNWKLKKLLSIYCLVNFLVYIGIEVGNNGGNYLELMIQGGVIFLGSTMIFVNRVNSLIVIEELKVISNGNIEYEIPEVYTNELNKIIRKVNRITKSYEYAIDEKVRHEKLKTELISNVSHDLRTPLTSIINYVNILEDDNLREVDKREYIDILSKKSIRLKNLINDLFELSKLSSGGVKLERQKIDLVEFINQISGEYDDALRENGLMIKFKSEEESILLNLDGKYMSKALDNLIKNICTYSLQGTRVYICIEEYNEQVSIGFRNIANYEMNFDNEEILENSVKGDKSRGSNPDGAGLGLAIVKTIVELHEGQVKIETEGDMFKLFILLDKGEFDE